MMFPIKLIRSRSSVVVMSLKIIVKASGSTCTCTYMYICLFVCLSASEICLHVHVPSFSILSVESKSGVFTEGMVQSFV